VYPSSLIFDAFVGNVTNYKFRIDSTDKYSSMDYILLTFSVLLFKFV